MADGDSEKVMKIYILLKILYTERIVRQLINSFYSLSLQKTSSQAEKLRALFLSKYSGKNYFPSHDHQSNFSDRHH